MSSRPTRHPENTGNYLCYESLTAFRRETGYMNFIDPLFTHPFSIHFLEKFGLLDIYLACEYLCNLISIELMRCYVQ